MMFVNYCEKQFVKFVDSAKISWHYEITSSLCWQQQASVEEIFIM